MLTVLPESDKLPSSKINSLGVSMFKVGDLAVYPAQGVGVIEAIENREVGGNKQLFYIMKIMGNGMKIMIPMNSAKSVGLREVIMETEIPKVYAILRKKDVTIDKQTWNKRYREYLEKIKTGSVFEIARVLRDLFILKSDKNLSFGERKMMDTAKNLLIKEISVASNAEETKIEEDLRIIFTVQ
jgi:CarD family transcriptional regulator